MSDNGVFIGEVPRCPDCDEACESWERCACKGHAEIEVLKAKVATLEKRMDRAGDIMANMDVIATALTRRVEDLDQGK